MSRKASSTTARRVRRQFSEEFKGPSGWSSTKARASGAIARELDLTASAFGAWVQAARVERMQGKSGLLKEERDELARLRTVKRTSPRSATS